MSSQELSRRERKVLEAVILSYVETAEPAGSRTLSRRFGLGVSPATIRNTMSDLEEKGFPFHPHTSPGPVPTNKADRAYADPPVSIPALLPPGSEQLAETISGPGGASRSRRYSAEPRRRLGCSRRNLAWRSVPAWRRPCSADSSSF